MKTKVRSSRRASARHKIGRAVANARRERQTRKAETPYDRVKHLLGVLKDLPSDLSSNPKYLEGFGE